MTLLRLSFLLMAIPSLVACDSLRQDLGLGRTPPDEFAVVDQAPLAMPPNFDLRPPRAGEPRPQDNGASDQARTALFGEKSGKDGEASPAVQKLLAATGADHADPSIRSVIDRETAERVEADQRLIDTLLWWKDTPQPGTTVDAAAEAARIRHAHDQGEGLTQTPVPVIERGKSGWLGP